MHFLLLVTNTDKTDVDTQLAPYWEEGEEYFEKTVEVENNEQAVQKWLDSEEDLIRTYEKEDSEWAKKWRIQLDRIKRQDTLQDKLKQIAKFEGYTIDENGNVCSEYNPNARWDWFSIGGRWNNWLVDKNGNRVNVCKVKDIDWAGIRQAEIDSASEYYDSAIQNAKNGNGEVWFKRKDGTIPTKEEYVARFDYEPAPFALLHNGEWSENDSDTESSEDWTKWFKQMIGTLDPESEITVVDYHI